MSVTTSSSPRHAGSPSPLRHAFRPGQGRHAGPPAPFPRRAVLLALAALALIALAFAAVMALTSGHQSRPSAPQSPRQTAVAIVLTAKTTAVTCSTTHTYSRSVSSAGTVRQTWTTKIGCGHDYRKWEHITSSSRTGAHYTEDVYRNELNYPSWWQRTVKNAWSAKGTYTFTDTVTSG